MGRETVLRLLKNHQLELHNLGVLRLAIFGSIARNEAHPGSDVDLLVEFDPPITFDRYMRAKFFLEDLLQCPVDLVFPETLKDRARPYVEEELIHVA
ncbi:MAG: nucleotidyltransferase family protein [Planctomycetes bacterium]|nr:nucleotidyltransferase family protein [Planctomycetota bacterium]